MLTTYSPHRESCGMVQIHPQGHPSQYDPHSAIREIRRSLSRSPSKGSDGFRQFAFRSSPAQNSIPFSPSPLSPSRRSISDNGLHLNSFSAPHGNRLNQVSRIHRPALRRSVQGHSIIRNRTSPKSPSKRALSDLSDTGNSTPMLRKRSSAEAEVDIQHDQNSSHENKENNTNPSEDNMIWKSVQSRQEKRRSGGFLTDVPPLSPMKRAEASIGLDQSDFGSPSAKRRSVHTSSGLDFSIFDSESLQNSNEQKRSQDDNDWFQPSSPLSANRFSTIPKRSSSLRKSTLQQRQPERFNQYRLGQVTDEDLAWGDITPGQSGKKGLRMSLDNHLPAMQRESPFSVQGSLLNASIHPMTSGQNSQTTIQRHPLSRTMTQSSSTPSVQDDSPTHEPIRRPDRPKSTDFSKSLPVGAMRPYEDLSSQEEPEYSSQGSFATPANYKTARPLPAAFMSTGLISKKNRNVDEPDAGLSKALMPDTPCKKQSIIFGSNDKLRPIHEPAKQRAAFGTPATPAETGFGISRAQPLPWGKTSIFGNRNTQSKLSKKTSFTSIETDEKVVSRSPSGQGDSQSTDTDFPPTPTKHNHIEFFQPNSASPSSHKRPHGPSPCNPGSSQVSRFTSSKLSPVQASPDSTDSDGGSVMEISPSSCPKPKPVLTVLPKPSSSFMQSRALRNLNSPTPLSRKDSLHTSLFLPSVRRTKIGSLTPVSPHLDAVDHMSPHTPQETVFPPDPSGLSISGRGERPVTRPGSGHLPMVPATPTGPREYFGNFSNRPSLNLNGPDVTDVDRSLSSRFDKVDLVGTGEFSQVYRVCRPPEVSPFTKAFGPGSTQSTSKSSLPERVWAVKKSRYAYLGPKDRQRKVHEVDVLKALGHGEHIVNFVESWEDRGHLYIQTEFCEEGTLENFLAQVGLKARLDDFRIWKILLELSLGLKHVHHSGFIHLDLKPANILITFDGTLKIGDFGMATRWPARAGIDGEGDREYIGPEILEGQYDKPADIFALGLIMLETAGNVELPDNGVSWQKLRQGDMSDVPSLTWSSEDSNILRDLNGDPLSDNDQDEPKIGLSEVLEHKMSHNLRRGELVQPPNFMIDPSNEQALDRVVRWMISPTPHDRPVVEQVLETQGVRFVETRRRAGGTIFEGNWGPADEIIAEDAEMIDV